MRTLIQYLRQMFCKHEWDVAELRCSVDTFARNREGVRVSMTCRRCGWHKSFWKFL